MHEKTERSKDYWSTKPINAEWYFINRYDRLWSGCEGQGAELINVGPGPKENPTKLLCDHSEETLHRIRVVQIEPVPGDTPYTNGIYSAWKRLGITDVVAREVWVDKTPLVPIDSIPVNLDKIVVELEIDWENRRITPKVIV